METRRFFIDSLENEKTLIIEHSLQGVKAWVVLLNQREITIYLSPENIWWENGVGRTKAAEMLGKMIETAIGKHGLY